MIYEEKDIKLETSYWQPETGGAKNTYMYLLKFLIVEYSTDKDLRIQLETIVKDTQRFIFYDLPANKKRMKIKLPIGITAQKWKVSIYNIGEKPKAVELQYIGVLGIPIPIGDRLR